MENATEIGTRSWGTRLFWFVILTALVYLGAFGLVILDECWLETRFIAKHTPAWTADVFRTVYAPLLSDFWNVSYTNSVSK
jgi:hypothetical protein